MTDSTALWAKGYKNALDDAEKIVQEMCAEDNVLAHAELLTRLAASAHTKLNGVEDLYIRAGYDTGISDLKFACDNAIENGYPTAYDTEFLQVIVDARVERNVVQEA